MTVPTQAELDDIITEVLRSYDPEPVATLIDALGQTSSTALAGRYLAMCYGVVAGLSETAYDHRRRPGRPNRSHQSKLEILQYHRTHDIHETVEHFGLAERTVRRYIADARRNLPARPT